MEEEYPLSKKELTIVKQSPGVREEENVRNSPETAVYRQDGVARGVARIVLEADGVRLRVRDRVNDFERLCVRVALTEMPSSHGAVK
jgi:hypothetical protein